VASIVEEVSLECGKDEAEVKRYFVAFWINYRRIADWQKILDRIEKGEQKINRLRQIRDALKEKVARHLDRVHGFGLHIDAKETDKKQEDLKQSELARSTTLELLEHSWPTMHFNYGLGWNKGRAYTEEEDAFLLYMMYKHGYGAAERIRLEIRRALHFRFDWYFKSRTAQEIQKRCDMLVKVVEKENEALTTRGTNYDGQHGNALLEASSFVN